MTTEEAQKVLDELQKVRPEVLTGEAKRLFEAIMKIADTRDEAILFLTERLKNSIPKQKIKDKIEKYKKISNELYIKFLESDRYDTNIRDKGIKCDAVVQVLQELLEEE